MTTTYVGLTAGSIVAGGSLLRATFQRKLLAVFASPSDGYKELQTNLPQQNSGYVASPFVNTPESDSFTVDWRTALQLNTAAGNLAAQTGGIVSYAFELTRLELLGVKQPGYNSPAASSGESAAAASINRQLQSDLQDAKPKWYEQVASGLGKSVEWVLTAAKWLAAVLVVLVVLFLYFKTR